MQIPVIASKNYFINVVKTLFFFFFFTLNNFSHTDFLFQRPFYLRRLNVERVFLAYYMPNVMRNISDGISMRGSVSDVE